jgi:hypothetical protein
MSLTKTRTPWAKRTKKDNRLLGTFIVFLLGWSGRQAGGHEFDGGPAETGHLLKPAILLPQAGPVRHSTKSGADTAKTASQHGAGQIQ